jgi:hypothetical protein
LTSLLYSRFIHILAYPCTCAPRLDESSILLLHARLCGSNAHTLHCHLEIIKCCCTRNITFPYPPKYSPPSQVPGIGAVCFTCISNAIEHPVLSARGCVEANRPIHFPVNVHTDIASCAAPNCAPMHPFHMHPPGISYCYTGSPLCFFSMLLCYL